jgi:Ca2+-binding RTX toxin-like protein
VQFKGTGSGRVVMTPPGMSCRSDCSLEYQPGSRVILQGYPDDGSVLTAVTGCDAATLPQCEITVFGDHFVQFYFDLAGGPPTPIPQPAPPVPQVLPGAQPPAGGVCTIVGTAGGDVLTGSAGSDVVCGLGGPDHIHGGGGSDVVYAGSGSDVVEGGAGDDLLVGGVGNDRLHGEAGADTLTGGAGRDSLFGGRGRDDLRARDGRRDRLDGGRGFDVARSDRFDAKRAVERSA